MVVMGRSERGLQRGDHRLEWKERDVEREKTALFSLYIALPPATSIIRIYVSSYIREIGSCSERKERNVRGSYRTTRGGSVGTEMDGAK